MVAPIACHAFFEKSQFERLFRDLLFEILRCPAQFLDLISVCSPRCVTRQPLLTGFNEVFGSLVVEALRYAFTAAQLSNTVLAAQAIQHDLDLLFG